MANIKIAQWRDGLPKGYDISDDVKTGFKEVDYAIINAKEYKPSSKGGNMNDELQPQSSSAEDAVLGACLEGGAPIFERAEAWIQKPEAFYFKEPRSVWVAIKTLYKDREPIDEVTVYEKMKDMSINNDAVSGYYLTGLRDGVPTVETIERYAKIVWERFIQREAGKTARILYKTSFKNNDSLTNILEEHSKLIDELKEMQPSRKQDIEKIMVDAVESIKTHNNIITFGIKQLDAIAYGMTRKEITVLGGRPGHGKSVLALNIARSLVNQGYKVMLFNREMSNTETAKRLLVIESGNLWYTNVRSGKLSEDELTEIDAVSELMKEKYENLLMYDDVRKLSTAIREVSKHKPDVIIDDYIQLIDAERPNEDRRFQLERILHEYKWICKKLDCSAILISQLNREIEKRIDPRPKMSDYSESGAIEQTAETALFNFYGWNFDSEEYDQYECEVYAAKSRYGTIGRYVLGFNGNRCTFYDSRAEAVKDETQTYMTEKGAPVI